MLRALVCMQTVQVRHAVRKGNGECENWQIMWLQLPRCAIGLQVLVLALVQTGFKSRPDKNSNEPQAPAAHQNSSIQPRRTQRALAAPPPCDVDGPGCAAAAAFAARAALQAGLWI